MLAKTGTLIDEGILENSDRSSRLDLQKPYISVSRFDIEVVLCTDKNQFSMQITLELRGRTYAETSRLRK